MQRLAFEHLTDEQRRGLARHWMLMRANARWN